jgi:hypothetical protein
MMSTKKNTICRFIKTHFLRYENEHSTSVVARVDIKEIRKSCNGKEKEMNHEDSFQQGDCKPPCGHAKNQPYSLNPRSNKQPHPTIENYKPFFKKSFLVKDS